MNYRRGKTQAFSVFVLGLSVLFQAQVRGEATSAAQNIQNAVNSGQVTERQVQFYMAIPAFSGIVSTISEVNRSMREAAENPMDKWRRQNVRAAISKMPGAIRELAGVFFQGQLHNKDLPIIQGMLGGFIDVNAADNYKKFLRNPDASLIPSAGPGFPIDLKKPTPTITSAKIALSDPKFSQQGESKKLATPGLVGSSELADLSAIGTGAPLQVNGVAATTSVGFNDAAPEGRGAAATTSSGQLAALEQGLGSGLRNFVGGAINRLIGRDDEKDTGAREEQAPEAAPNGGGENFFASVQRDIALLEGGFGEGAEEEECNEEEDEDCEDGVFKLDADKKKKKGPTRHKHGKGLRKGKNSSYKISAKPKNWRAVSGALSLLPTTKKAEAISLSQVADAVGFTPEMQRLAEVCGPNNNSPECRRARARERDFADAVDVLNGRSNSRSGGRGASGSGGGAGGGSGGGGGGRGIGSALAAAGGIVQSVMGAVTTAVVAAEQAGVAKHQASEKARENITNALTKADVVKTQSKDQRAVKEKELGLFAFLGRLREQAKTFDTMVSTIAATMFAGFQREDRAAARRSQLATEMKTTELIRDVQRGQNALQTYLLKATALLGLTPNRIAPNPNQIASAGIPPVAGGGVVGLPPPSQPGLRSAGGIVGVSSSERLLQSVRSAKPDPTVVASVSSTNSAIDRVRRVLRGSTRSDRLRPPTTAKAVTVRRAVASLPGAVRHRPSSRAAIPFGASKRPTHSK